MDQAGGSGAPRDRRQVLAAVDLGSNSFHMIVARYEHGQLTVIDKLREMVRLAAGLDDGGRIPKPVARRALNCIERFGQRLRDMHAGNVRAVGTNALRKAKNAGQFLADAEEALGYPIEVVSGREEARLVYLGAAQSLPEADGKRLVVDIGGGSTELIIGEGFEPLERFSLYMGCVGHTEKFFPKGKVTQKRWRRAQLAAAMELEPVVAALKNLGWEQAIGTSGTIRTAQAVVRAHSWCEEMLTLEGLQKLRDYMLDRGASDRLSLTGLSAERMPVFVGGVSVLHAVFQALDINKMRAARGALREGLIYDMVGRLGSEDARDRSVAALQKRYHVDTAQALRVQNTVSSLHSQVRAEWKLDDELSRDLLDWAAGLHEIGIGIAHAQYHRHGGYLLQHSDLAGFSNREKSLLAALVLSHRRKIRPATFEALPAPWAKRLPALAVLLRLAVLVHRSRIEAAAPPIRLIASKRTLTVRLPQSWIDAHPLTRADLDQEVQYLEAINYKLVLEVSEDTAAAKRA